jgi:hypothetical protein
MTRSAAIALAILLTGTAAVAQGTNRPVPTEYAGETTNLTSASGIPVSIRIFNWSSDEDRQRVVPVLTTASTENKGVPDLTKQLGNTPSVGQIWTDGPIGYSLKYAHRQQLSDGHERIIVVTDRPLGAIGRPGPWKAEGESDNVAPFTIVELRVNKDGKGEGKMSLGGPFTSNAGDHTVELSNYDKAPVTLKNIELKPKPYWAS